MKSMNAYEFTRFEADFTANEKAHGYDLGTIEMLIGYNNPTRNLREEPEYEEAMDVFMDLTMSCNEKERLHWALYWTINAIAYGNQTQNRDWMYKFLAAYDLYKMIRSHAASK